MARPVRGPAGQRLPVLDGLRGIAITLVVAVHASYFLVPQWANSLVPGGFVGVDLFFVLSGYLITGLLLGEAAGGTGIDLRGFYRRRARRLLPALCTYLLVQVLYIACVQPQAVAADLAAAVPVLLFAGNLSPYAGIAVPFTLAQMWSLGVEEQFYLLWPAAVRLLRRPRRVLVLSGVLCVLSVAATALLVRSGHSRSLLYSAPEVRVVELGAGAAVAAIQRDGRRMPRLLCSMAWLPAGFLGWVAWRAHAVDPWLYQGGFAAIAVAASWLVGASVSPHVPPLLQRLLSSAVLRWAGRISYSAYLWHMLVFAVTVRLVPSGDIVLRAALGLAATVAVSSLSHRCVEQRWAARGAPGRPVAVELPL